MLDHYTETLLAQMVTALLVLHPDRLPGIAERIAAYKTVIDLNAISLPVDRLAAIRYMRAKVFA